MTMNTDEVDVTKLRYVLYARKSTTDESRQVRSIPDQIRECKELVTRLGLHIVGKPLQETQSAKLPRKRPIFRQMISDIKQKKYDGILAWNPDRLARNMLEGGEIIDLIDQGIIKDLKFVTHHFTPDANGKMLLGMAFVLSKQYSDDLSQKVTRGVRAKFAEGKGSAPKHGYVRDKDGYYRPDGKNHRLIKDAWHMRVEGKSILDIVAHMNREGYGRKVKKTGKQVKMSKQTLSSIFHDTFYYGVLAQGGETIDLRSQYDFAPACTEADYNAVQQLGYRRIKPSKPHTTAFYPLRLMVLCSHCGRTMRVGPSTGRQKRYLYFRCDNPECSRSPRSIRSKIVFDFIYGLLADGLPLTKADYDEYSKALIAQADAKRQELTVELHKLQAQLKVVKAEIRDRSLKIVKFDEKSIPYKENLRRIDELDGQKHDVLSRSTAIAQQLTDPESDRLTIEQFLNLAKNAGAIVKSGNAVAKDTICRLIFLNLTVDTEKVTSYQLKEPFATLLKSRIILPGRGAEN